MEADVRELKKFSIMLFFAFGILGLLVFWQKGDAGFVLCGIGLAIILCGLTRPKLLAYPYIRMDETIISPWVLDDSSDISTDVLLCFYAYRFYNEIIWQGFSL